MYKIIFKGVGIDPIFVEDDSKGKIIMDSWVEDKKTRMVFKNTAFFTGDIKQIIKLEKSAAEMSKGMPDNVENEYLDFRKKMLSLSLESRASIMRIPKLVWSAHSESVMPDEVKEQIKERQLAYFTENPNCIYANPKIYRDLIPPRAMRSQVEDMKPIQNVFGASALRFIENMIQTDLVYSAK